MNIPNELTPEYRAAYDRHRSREATEDDLLSMAMFEAHGALHSLPPHCLPTEGGMPYNEDHANAAAHRCLSFLRELYARRHKGPEWCEHCSFAKHVHSDTFSPPGCIGFVPQGADRCEKRESEGLRCSLVAGHDGHHEIHTPYDDSAKPMPRAQVSSNAAV